ncbi:hypothetical protein [Terribacillus sp. DMT04]|uniref:hypothetical protein n=1 Tax=Terribacillus sp. DMT04 TaxID=2850441 RepID=UPI001C2C602B|nr:hypothetical protein [Terribacillus sp. DMT04]QXE00620.1 hypothetical protein KS242_11385 [Terribacillus sp. DMT04]
MMLNEIDIYSNEETPYFQTTDKYRIRFVYNLFYKYRNRELLRDIIHLVTSEDTLIKATFCVASYSGGKRYGKKIGVGKFLKITNWKEKIIDYSESFKLIYAEVNFRNEDVFKLISYIIEDRIYGPIVFQTKQYIIYTSTDVLDIMAEEVQINQLKKEFSGLVITIGCLITN